MSSTLQSINMPLMRERCVTVSLPFDGSRRLGRIIIDDAIDALNLVDDAGRHPAQEGSVEWVDVGGHAIERGDGAKRADAIVGPVIAHYADCPYRKKHGERLPDRIVQAGV